MIEFLKNVLSKETYEKVVEEFKGKGKDGKDYEVLPSDGTYIPKTKFDEVNTQKSNLERERNDLKQQLDSLKNSDEDVTQLKEKVTELSNTITENDKKHKEELQEQKLSNALKLAIIKDVQDVDIVSSLIDKTKLTMDENGEKITMGLNEQIEGLKKQKPFLFKETDKQDLEGGNPPPAGNPNNNKVTDKTLSLEDAVAEELKI